jgi:spore maturation protein CgeB
VSHASNNAPDLLIVGSRHGTHIGGSLARAADRLEIPHAFVDADLAFDAPRLVRLMTWRLGGHRPPCLSKTSRAVASACARWQPRWLLTTGMAPIDAPTLEQVGRMGITRLNYLTDDPWNPSLRAAWFFDALKQYDHVFSPRQANIEDLRQHGCGCVSYLPFGYDPELCFREEPCTPRERMRFAADLAFVGGADRDRVPYLNAAIRAGVDVALYGGYWNRFPETRRQARGHADVATVRKITSAAKVALCLVRRANRDGHVMRSLEIPAMGGCLLAEDTQEHRALFGPPGHAAAYFRTLPDLLEQLDWLLSAENARQRLAVTAQRSIHEGQHTYADRLRAMLGDAVSSC